MYEVTIDWDGENQTTENFELLTEATEWAVASILHNGREFTYFTVQVIA